MNIAVIGGGIAGLSCGWLLSESHNVTLFEKHPTIGMDASSIDLELDSDISGKEKVRVDVPLRVFSPTYYPNLTKLYDTIGVKVVPEDYSGSFNSEEGKTYFQYTNYLFKNRSISFIPFGKQLLSPVNWKILYDIGRFFYHSPRDLQKHIDTKYLRMVTFYDYLKDKNYSDSFIDGFMLPLCAAMCTCSFSAVKAYPAPILLEYLVVRSGYGVRRVGDGVKTITQKLSQKYQQVNCGANIKAVYSSGSKVIVELEDGDKKEYDHVVLATEAFSALKLLKEPTVQQKGALSLFPYEHSKVSMHTDASLMPLERNNWAPVNLFVSECEMAPMATIWMNKVQDELKSSKTDVFQTWNPIKTIKSGHLLSEASFSRPLVTLDAVRGMDILSKAQGENNIWVCGSYCLYGMPLLENAVCSGLSVAEAIGGTKRPWTQSECKKVDTLAFTIKATIFLLSFLVVAILSLILK